MHYIIVVVHHNAVIHSTPAAKVEKTKQQDWGGDGCSLRGSNLGWSLFSDKPMYPSFGYSWQTWSNTRMSIETDDQILLRRVLQLKLIPTELRWTDLWVSNLPPFGQVNSSCVRGLGPIMVRYRTIYKVSNVIRCGIDPCLASYFVLCWFE